MRKVAPILLIVAFAAITLFGYLVMAHESHQGGCIGATMAQSTCPSDTGLASINFHIDSLKAFTTAIFDAASLQGFLAIALGLTLLLLAKFAWGVLFARTPLITPQYHIRERVNHVKATSQTLHWILRLNNSPSVA